MWLSGYGNRTHPSEGKLQDLYVKALALEDARGNKLVLLTSDRRVMRDRINPRWLMVLGWAAAAVMGAAAVCMVAAG